MGLSASQARFLELTARKSDVEYQAQRINFERLRLADMSTEASAKYNEAMSNRKLTYTFNTGAEKCTVDLTYQNYKSYMNQQVMQTASQKMFLVSCSGNKIIVSNEEDMEEIINSNMEKIPVSDVDAAKQAVQSTSKPSETAQATNTTDSGAETADATAQATPYQNLLASKDFSDYQLSEIDGKMYYVKSTFDKDDFIIAPDLDDVENFQKAIQEGIYYFATYGKPEGEDEAKFTTMDWATLGAGAINEEYDKSDDAMAQAEYDDAQNKIQAKDKKLELELNRLETEREAIDTELDSVKKVLEDNVESSFKVFS